MKDKKEVGKKGGRKRRESLLRLIRVIIGGQSMQRQLEGVDMMRRVVDGEEGGDGRVRGRRVVGTTPRPSPHRGSHSITQGDAGSNSLSADLKITRASQPNVPWTRDQPPQQE